jgi:hypothetical protein
MEPDPDQKLTRTRPTSVSAMALLFLTGMSLVGLFLLTHAVVDQPALAAETGDFRLRPASPERPISLRDRLLTGLRARLKSEVAYVDAVVFRVERGELPERLVDETFFWARLRSMSSRRAGRTLRPIVYFQPGMTARAKRIGVEI